MRDRKPEDITAMATEGSGGPQRTDVGHRRAMKASWVPHLLLGPLINKGGDREGEGECGYRKAKKVAERVPKDHCGRQMAEKNLVEPVLQNRDVISVHHLKKNE